MGQELVVIAILGGCAAWLGRQVYRFFVPRAGGKVCGGNCCSGGDAPAPRSSGAGSAAAEKPLVMISSDDLRARLKARRG